MARRDTQQNAGGGRGTAIKVDATRDCRMADVEAKLILSGSAEGLLGGVWPITGRPIPHHELPLSLGPSLPAQLQVVEMVSWRDRIVIKLNERTRLTFEREYLAGLILTPHCLHQE
ncbi:hypothetical protein AAG570_006575 [Ranatra chinensis]|uniref:Uncharacterized protein n=1 Tax=Ranatra chinensis TaxID=642074 RepID=A0ABD0YUD4_9HEMI